ncbi:hypothetical protein L2E82_50046 [Cichorium intybus]|nr:hypothetical protein L2E82_50046 [Cichorium intybus]
MNLDRLWFGAPPELVPDESRSDLVWISTGFGMNLHLNPIPDMIIHLDPSPIFGFVKIRFAICFSLVVGCKKVIDAAESWCCLDENTLAAQKYLKLLQTSCFLDDF